MWQSNNLSWIVVSKTSCWKLEQYFYFLLLRYKLTFSFFIIRICIWGTYLIIFFCFRWNTCEFLNSFYYDSYMTFKRSLHCECIVTKSSFSVKNHEVCCNFHPHFHRSGCLWPWTPKNPTISCIHVERWIWQSSGLFRQSRILWWCHSKYYFHRMRN